MLILFSALFIVSIILSCTNTKYHIVNLLIFCAQLTDVTGFDQNDTRTNNFMNEFNTVRTCIDCWTSVLIVQMGNGDFSTYPEICEAGTTCTDSTGQCEISTHYECDSGIDIELEFCTELRVFPDPFNCKKYHICDENTFESGECKDNYAFDLSTKSCSKKIEDGDRCLSPVPVCLSSIQSGTLKGDSSIFYTCEEMDTEESDHFFPHLSWCASNQYHDGFECVDLMPDVVDQVGKCLKEGLFYYPDSCVLYRECAVKGAKPVTRACAQLERFDPKLSKCVLFDCSNCRF